MSADAEILVAGTGPVGLTAALALARAGFRVALVGSAPSGEDERTTAVMAGALALFDALGVKPKWRDVAAPLRAMRIVDGSSRLLRAPPVTFRASEIGEDAFGWNVPNRCLSGALAEAATAQPSIRWHRALVERWELDGREARAVLQDGSTVNCRLVAAADGRLSPAREAADIQMTARALPQSALALSFGHARDHGYESTEFHTETGPFTQVPLPGGRRSSLVWVERPERARELHGLDDAALSLAVERRMGSMLGRVTVEPGRQVFPLTSALPRRFAARRVALLGEAAHVLPPIGAQGFNLGVRDVADLVRTAERHREDLGSDGALAEYDRARRLDILSRSAAVDVLNRSLLTSFLPVQLARGAGLAALSAIGPLRRTLMRQGLGPAAAVLRR